MTRGRKSEAADLVGRLRGSDAAKARLIVILETLAGRRTTGQAGATLGLAERRLQSLRRRTLQAALASLEPRPPGRPSRAPVAGAARVAELEATNRELRIDLQAAQVREEIALTMPQLLRGRGAKRGHGRRARSGRSGGRSGSAPSASARRVRAGAGRPASGTPAGGSGAPVAAPSPSAAGRRGSG